MTEQTINRRQHRADLQRENWGTVRAYLQCKCTSPDPEDCTGSPEPGAPQCGPAQSHRQCSCHHIRTEAEHRHLRDRLDARNNFDPEKVARDYAAALGDSTHPDAAIWSEALVWIAERIHGGHLSIYANRDFVARFGVNPYPGEPQ